MHQKCGGDPQLESAPDVENEFQETYVYTISCRILAGIRSLRTFVNRKTTLKKSFAIKLIQQVLQDFYAGTFYFNAACLAVKNAKNYNIPRDKN